MDLSDDIYREHTLKAIDFARKGQYRVSEYLTIMHFAERMDNILELNLMEVQQQLIDGFKKAVVNPKLTSGEDFMQFEFSGGQQGLSTHVLAVYERGLQLVAEERKRRAHEKIAQIAALFVNKPIVFQEEVQADSGFRVSVDNCAFINTLEMGVLFEKTVNADASTIFYYTGFLADRYMNTQLLQAEKVQINDLVKRLQIFLNENASNKPTIQLYFIRQMVEKVSKLLKTDFVASEGMLS